MHIDYQRIKTRRENLNLFQKDVANLVDVSEHTIWRLERGANVRLSTVKRICEALELPYSEVVLGDSSELNDRGADYDVDLQRKRWALYYERIPPSVFDRFCELVEAALKLLE